MCYCELLHCIVMAFVKKADRMECCGVWIWGTTRRRSDVALVRPEERINDVLWWFW